mgnify:CR=1 FL=1
MLAQLHGRQTNHPPALRFVGNVAALRFVGNVAALEGGTPARVFTAPALEYPQRLAVSLAPTDIAGIKELLWTFSN